MKINNHIVYKYFWHICFCCIVGSILVCTYCHRKVNVSNSTGLTNRLWFFFSLVCETYCWKLHQSWSCGLVKCNTIFYGSFWALTFIGLCSLRSDVLPKRHTTNSRVRSQAKKKPTLYLPPRRCTRFKNHTHIFKSFRWSSLVGVDRHYQKCYTDKNDNHAHHSTVDGDRLRVVVVLRSLLMLS